MRIMNDEKPNNKTIACIGGANIDIQGFAHEPIRLRDSNPGRLELSPGGVSRNIAENLAHMGLPVKMISVTGDDYFGSIIREGCRLAGIDISEIEILKGQRSSAYMALTDADGDMLSGLSDMHILKNLGSEFVLRHLPSLEAAEVIMLDPNLSEEALRTICNTLPGKMIFADPISTAYAGLLKKFISGIYWMKSNIYEAEILAGMPISNDTEMEKAANAILECGPQCVTITLGGHGAFHKEKGCASLRIPAIPTNMLNATGAGDAFAAGLIYGLFQNWDIEKTLEFATAASSLTISHVRTVNPELSVEKIQKVMR